MPSTGILDRLKSGSSLLLDGGTGSELQRRGIDVLKGATAEGGLQAWSATANMEAPEAVREVHGDYLRAGADIIISNNFWTSPASEWRRLDWATDGKHTPARQGRTRSRRATP